MRHSTAVRPYTQRLIALRKGSEARNLSNPKPTPR
jgi:hypothetical protein